MNARAKPNIKIFLSITLVVLAALGFLIWNEQRGPRVGGDFTLTHRTQSWTLKGHKKPLSILYIGYVKCPDVCPMALSFSAAAFKKLSPGELEKIQLLFLSVDSEHDTPDSVADYAEQFSPGFIGLTGSLPAIRKVVDQYQASFVVEQAPKTYLGYSISHTDRLFFLNKNGIVIDSISQPRTSEEILTKIKEHL